MAGESRTRGVQEEHAAFERGYDAFAEAMWTGRRAENPHRGGRVWSEWQAGYHQAEHEHRQRLEAYRKWCQARRAKGFTPPLSPAPRPVPASPRQRKQRRAE